MWVRQARAGAAWRLSIPRWQNLSGSKTLEPPPRAEGRGGGDDKASFPWGFTVAAGTPAARARRWRCVGMGGVGKHIPYDSDMISYRPQ